MAQQDDREDRDEQVEQDESAERYEDGNAEYSDLLPPHPLICGLAVGAVRDLAEAGRAAAYWLAPLPAVSNPAAWSDIWWEDLAAFPSPQRAQVVVFAGYLGPQLTTHTQIT